MTTLYVWLHDTGGFWPAAPFLANEPLALGRLYAAYCRAVPGSVPTSADHGRALAPVDFLTWLERQYAGRCRSVERVEFTQGYEAIPDKSGEFHEARPLAGVLAVDGAPYIVSPSFVAGRDESLPGMPVLRFGFVEAGRWPRPRSL